MRIVNPRLALFAWLLLACLPRAMAGESIGPRTIASIGCHNTDGTCYVVLVGSAFGASLGCTSGATTEFRFDNGETAVGRRTYASLLAAHLSNRPVNVYLEGCTSQGVPRLIYFHVLG